MAQVAHTAQGFSDQYLDRIESALATMRVWTQMWRENEKRTWDDVSLLYAVALRLERVEDFWNDADDGAVEVE